MPWTLARDETAKRIVAIGEGEFRAGEVIQVLAELRDAGAWTYGMLFDCRRMSGATTVADVKPINEVTASLDEPRGPIAIIATDPHLYSMACAYAALPNSGTVAVFRSPTEADQWLASQMP